MVEVKMTVSQSQVQIPMSVSSDSILMPMNISAEYRIVDGERYDGDYEVTPRLTEQELATRNKLLINNVTINEIPVVYTSNPYDGKTVVIG